MSAVTDHNMTACDEQVTFQTQPKVSEGPVVSGFNIYTRNAYRTIGLAAFQLHKEKCSKPYRA